MKNYFKTAIFILIFASALQAQITYTGVNLFSNEIYRPLFLEFINNNYNPRAFCKVNVRITGKTGD